MDSIFASGHEAVKCDAVRLDNTSQQVEMPSTLAHGSNKGCLMGWPDYLMTVKDVSTLSSQKVASYHVADQRLMNISTRGLSTSRTDPRQLISCIMLVPQTV